jgi:hypothetical protein
MAGIGNEKVAAPTAPALPNRTSRRETAIKSSRFVLFRARHWCGRWRSRLRPVVEPSARIKFEPDVDALSRASA